MTLDELMQHHDRNVRGAAYEVMREISILQLEEHARSVPLFVEKRRSPNVIKETFRPLS